MEDDARERKREEILATAEALFFERGYAQTTVADIVEALGVTKPYLYYYFNGKDDIFEQLCWRASVACLTSMHTEDGDTRPAGARLQQGLHRLAMQSPNGVINVVVADEAGAARVARQYLAYFQGPVATWDCADQRPLRHAVPENRLRSYDIRALIDTLADTSSVLELRREFGVGMITALVRIEGRPVGLIANSSVHLGGAIDADGADKAARFMQLCDAFGLPIVSLCDTPGFMVGPDAEATAMVRHVSRMFVTVASLSVPLYTIVLRKGYGLGAQAMATASFAAPFFTIAWPSAEFGAMGIEGSIRLGYRKELEAIVDPDERKRKFDGMVAAAYANGQAVNMASYLEIDDAIDPAETREWIVRGLKAAPPRDRSRRQFVDTW